MRLRVICWPLARTVNGADGARHPALFPLLDTLILHANDEPTRSNTQSHQPALELSLLDVLATRRSAGTPVSHIFIDKSMSEWNIWSKLCNGVLVSFFGLEGSTVEVQCAAGGMLC